MKGRCCIIWTTFEMGIRHDIMRFLQCNYALSIINCRCLFIVCHIIANNKLDLCSCFQQINRPHIFDTTQFFAFCNIHVSWGPFQDFHVIRKTPHDTVQQSAEILFLVYPLINQVRTPVAQTPTVFYRSETVSAVHGLRWTHDWEMNVIHKSSKINETIHVFQFFHIIKNNSLINIFDCYSLFFAGSDWIEEAWRPGLL